MMPFLLKLPFGVQSTIRPASALAAASCGLMLSGSELAVDKDDELIAFKVNCDTNLCHEARECLRNDFKRAFAGTKWENTLVIVCPKGIDVQVVKRSDTVHGMKYPYAEIFEKGRLTPEQWHELEKQNPIT